MRRTPRTVSLSASGWRRIFNRSDRRMAERKRGVVKVSKVDIRANVGVQAGRGRRRRIVNLGILLV